MFNVEEILNATKGKLISGWLEEEVSGVSIDSRTIKAGDLFIVIKGERFDGHDFIAEAIRKGASAVIVQEGARYNVQDARLNLPLSNFHLPPIIEVANTIKAFGDLAHFYRSRFSLSIIGVTGSCGKTITKEIIAHLLSAAGYNVLKNEGTQNNQIGIPLTLFRLNTEHNVAILEFGSNHPGEIKYLAEIVSPKIGVITNIGPSHLEFFGDIEGVLHEKWSLVQLLPKDGVAVLNGDDPFLRCLPNSITFGIENESDIMAQDIFHSQCGSTFRVNFNPALKNNRDEASFNASLYLLGRHNIYNALAGIGAVSSFGLDCNILQKGIASFRSVHMRLVPIKINGFIVLDDTYNCNPLSMQAALEVLKDYPTKGRRVLVVGDMMELGEHSERYHRQIGDVARTFNIDSIVAVGKICEAIEDATAYYHSSDEAAERILEYIESGDTVLVKGSRAMKMEKIIDALFSPLPAS